MSNKKTKEPDYQVLPIWFFGSKKRAAPIVWKALGDVRNYIEPFCGSAAVLLKRPHDINNGTKSELINDKDGFIVNLLRSIKYYPQEVVYWSSMPGSSIEFNAARLAMWKWAEDRDNFLRMSADPLFCNPQIAGWYAYAITYAIGNAHIERGKYVISEDGRFVERDKNNPFHQNQHGISNNRPDFMGCGKAMNHYLTQEQNLHLTDQRRKELEMIDEPWVELTMNDYEQSEGFHPFVMPKMRKWMYYLSARLRHVKIMNRDWKSVLTPTMLYNLGLKKLKPGSAYTGIFFDPPYSLTVRDPNLYVQQEDTIPAEVRKWCIENGNNPKFRIVLAGYVGEGHEELLHHGWKEIRWYQHGFMTRGFNAFNKDKSKINSENERLWLSPYCDDA